MSDSEVSGARVGPLVVAVAGLKGGIAKTTTCIHLAGVLADAGQKVLLADGDRIRTSTSWARSGLLPFTVAPVSSLARARDYDVVILDTEGGPDNTELLEFARTADLTLLRLGADKRYNRRKRGDDRRQKGAMAHGGSSLETAFLLA